MIGVMVSNAKVRYFVEIRDLHTELDVFEVDLRGVANFGARSSWIDTA